MSSSPVRGISNRAGVHNDRLFEFQGAHRHRMNRVISMFPPPSGCPRLICFLGLLALASCEEELVPLAPIDGVFSINGYLDAARDTQWVRVTPFRTTILTTPDPVDAVVTLEHLGTGRIVELHPTVFTFPSPNFGEEAAYGHNFWTDEPIERGASYRLMARRSDGEIATSVVKIPRGLIDTTVLVEVARQVIFTPRAHQLVDVHFDIPGGDHLAFLSFDQYRKFPHPCSPRPIDHVLHPVLGETAGPLSFEWGPLLRFLRLPEPPPCDFEPYIRSEASIVVSGEHWPVSPGDFVGYLDQGSNIENGMGYLGGVVWEKVPVPFCNSNQSCKYYFGPETATVDVMVRGPDGNLLKYAIHPEFNISPLDVDLSNPREGWTRAADGPPAHREPLDFVPDLPITVRRFPGLLPGEYVVQFNRSPISRSPEVWTYCEDRTIVLAPGEHRVVEIQTMVRPPIPTEPLNARGCREG